MGRCLICCVVLHSVAAPAAAIWAAARAAPNATAANDCFSPYDNKPLMQISSCPPALAAEMRTIMETGGCICMGDGGELLKPRESCCVDAPAVCKADVAGRLVANYSRDLVAIVQENAGGFYRLTSGKLAPAAHSGVSLAPSLGFYEKWRTLQDQQLRIKQLVSHCKHAVREIVGHSVEKRNIWAVRFNGKHPKKDKIRILMTFQLHAREWITGMSAVYIIERLVERLESDPGWLQHVQLVIVPMANPDGFEYSASTDRLWRKNKYDGDDRCLGVDLNRNFPTDWRGAQSTSTSPCSEVYVGPHAGSEPETRAIMKVIDEGRLHLHLDYHAYGEKIVGPWSHKKKMHPRHAKIADLMGVMDKGIAGTGGRHFLLGAGSEVSYAASGVAPDYSTAQGAWGLTVQLSPNDGFMGGGFMLAEGEIKAAVHDAWLSTRAAVDWVTANRNDMF